MGSSKFKIAVDTGATINVIDCSTFEQMKDIELTRTNMKAYAYSKTSPVEFIGKFEAVIETKKRMSRDREAGGGTGGPDPPIIFPRLIEWRLIIISAAFSN